MSNFFVDRDERGAPFENLIVQHIYERGIPVGFNPFSGTEDPRREDFDIYIGHPSDSPLLVEAKMDWGSGLSGNIFVEEKTLNNTKSHKVAFGRLIIEVFDTDQLRELYMARNGKIYAYRHVSGGDQADNRGMLLDWRACKQYSQPFWQFVKQLNRN